MQNNLFNPQEAKSLTNLELRAKLVVEGFITGIHKSPYHGFSVEFSEHKQYRAGDNIKHIDWGVFARTNKYFIKQFEEETNLRCTIIVDSSKSMSYQSDANPSKYNYSVFLASTISLILNKQRDAVGLAVYNDSLIKYMPSRSKTSYVSEIIKYLETTTPSKETSTASSLNSLMLKLKRRGLIVLISDFFDDIKTIESTLNNFRHYEHDIILFQILDPKEINFNFKDSNNFVDLESNEEILTSPAHIKKEYNSLVENYIKELKSICYNKRIDYNLIQTDEPFDKALLKFFNKRYSK